MELLANPLSCKSRSKRLVNRRRPVSSNSKCICFKATGFWPDELTSHSTKLAQNASKVAGYAPE